MKICIVTTSFPRWENDTRGIFVYECALALHRRGHSVRVVAMHNPGAKKREVIQGIEVIRPQYLPQRWEILQKDSAGLPQVWKENPLAPLAILPFLVVHTLAAAIYARGCDILHANWSLSAFSVMAAKIIHRRPYVVTVQGSDIFVAAQKPGIRMLTRLALRRAKKVLALSRALAEETARLGVEPERIVVVQNGVDIRRFAVASDTRREPVILYVGSFIERKGCRYLIESFREVSSRQPDYRLVMVGEGSQKEELVTLTAQLGLDDRVTFTGLQTQEQVRSWMQRARVFVLPSLEEGQGVVVVEALACGTPCVGTRVGGIPDMIVPAVGRLVPPGDAPALAQAITAVIGDTAGWEEMSRSARERAKDHYDWDKIVERIIAIYQE